ncbi:MAG: hypothetical protein IPO64_11380 [Bacteroidetes bacterium]|nr:hypothetical protein [Bacteroidota bacterium]
MQDTTVTLKIIQQLIDAFNKEFHFIKDKFEIIDLLANKTLMNTKTIRNLKLPTNEYNIVWHPGVYVFIGNNELYRVGVSMTNSRARVLQHLDGCTTKDGFAIWDINKYEDKSILLFNVKNISDKHWLLAIETYLETKFAPLISAGRIG